MKHWATNTGKAQAEIVLQESASGVNTCENCGAEAVPTWWSGTGNECRACFAESISYWEDRGGFSSEGIFDSVNARRIPAESSRVYRAVMGSYFSTLRNGGK